MNISKVVGFDIHFEIDVTGSYGEHTK